MITISGKSITAASGSVTGVGMEEEVRGGALHSASAGGGTWSRPRAFFSRFLVWASRASCAFRAICLTRRGGTEGGKGDGTSVSGRVGGKGGSTWTLKEAREGWVEFVVYVVYNVINNKTNKLTT